MATSENTAARPASATPTPTRSDALKHLSTYRSYRGTYPFSAFDAGHASDRCGDILSQVAGLLSFMSAAYDDAQDLADKRMESGTHSLRATIMRSALDGLETLVDLAAFLVDELEC
jgi:hypothetical protein